LLITNGAEVDEEGQYGRTRITVTETHCEGHFPGQLVFPGKESMELVCQILGLTGGFIFSLAGIGMVTGCNCTFRRPARPDSKLTAEVWITKVERKNEGGRIRSFTGTGHITNGDNSVIAEVTAKGVVLPRRSRSPISA